MSVPVSVAIVLGDRGDRGSIDDLVAGRVARDPVRLDGGDCGLDLFTAGDDASEIAETDDAPESLLRAHASALFRVGRLLLLVVERMILVWC